jgi:hypothetical protein
MMPHNPDCDRLNCIQSRTIRIVADWQTYLDLELNNPNYGRLENLPELFIQDWLLIDLGVFPYVAVPGLLVRHMAPGQT